MFKRRTAIQALGLLSGITVLGAQQASEAMANS